MIQGRAIDTGDHLVFETGLKLAKAVNYDPAWHGSEREYPNDQSHFCVNADGQVTKFAGTPG